MACLRRHGTMPCTASVGGLGIELVGGDGGCAAGDAGVAGAPGGQRVAQGWREVVGGESDEGAVIVDVCPEPG